MRLHARHAPDTKVDQRTVTRGRKGFLVFAQPEVTMHSTRKSLQINGIWVPTGGGFSAERRADEKLARIERRDQVDSHTRTVNFTRTGYLRSRIGVGPEGTGYPVGAETGLGRVLNIKTRRGGPAWPRLTRSGPPRFCHLAFEDLLEAAFVLLWPPSRLEARLRHNH